MTYVADRSGLSTFGRAICTTALAALTVLVCGCDGPSAKDQDESVGAGQVCAGTLDASAARALERLSGTNRFEELTGTNEIGEPNAFSVKRAVQHLHATPSSRSSCTVYLADDNSGMPLLDLDLSASQSHPKRTETNSSRKRLTYPMGVYAAATQTGTQLFFSCTTEAKSADAYVGDTKYVEANMSFIGHARGGDEGRDRMTVLNSVARAVARAAGCATEAALPTTVPPSVG
ncbi:hypothetical protein [Streptomyces sp. NPDC006552]|uniref:hypothetical protein n=1 Tax=Streptomyces sp. NPDC006552 TaxID=3157179 RepID=UPI00339EE7FD